jgi:hypothetical protein
MPEEPIRPAERIVLSPSGSAGATPATADSATSRKLQGDLAADSGHAAAIHRGIRDAVDELGRAALAQAAADYDEASRRDHTVRDQALADLESELSARSADLQAELVSLAASLAPGPLCASWSADWSGHAEGAAGYVRIGADLQNDVPALAPLLGSPGWFVTGDAAAARELIQGALVRVMARIPAKHLRIAGYDPRLQGSLGIFAKLRSVDPAAFAPPRTTADQFHELLEEVLGVASANADLLAAHGVGDLAELWERTGTPLGTVVVVVVFDYPVDVDERTQALLERLADTAGQRGVTLLVQAGGSKPAPDVVPSRLASRLMDMHLAESGWITPDFPEGVASRHDGAPPAAVVDLVVRSAIDHSRSSTGPVVSFAELLAEVGDSDGVASSADGLVATIGRSGRQPVELALRSENPATANLLVGGSSGNGKSNLLLDIVYSLALRYSTRELEILLLDFKQGTEFARFDADGSGENWLPHARVLSLESNKDFGVAVLGFVAAELERRAQIFKDSRSNSITEHRRSTGEVMPRLLLIIDEFQALFEGSDPLTEQAVAIFEQLARQGRSFGIHLLLSSQTVSGISGLRVKGDSIFAQFPLRLSLKNTLDESQAILSRHNTAAADLTYRGEFVLNRNLGLDPVGSNERGMAAFAENAELVAMQRSIWLREHGARPLLFLGREYAPRPSAWARAEGQGIAMSAGMPVEVTDHPAEIELTDDVNQAVAIVGTGDGEARALVGSLAASAFPQLAEGARVIVLDGISAEGAPEPWVADIAEAAAATGLHARIVGRRKVAGELLDAIGPALREASAPMFVIALGLQRVTGLTDARIVAMDEVEVPAFGSAGDVLAELATRGAIEGHHLIVWSTTLGGLEPFGYDRAGLGTLVALSLNADDRRSLGISGEASEAAPRATIVDRASARPPRVIVPFVHVLASGSGRA